MRKDRGPLQRGMGHRVDGCCLTGDVIHRSKDTLERSSRSWYYYSTSEVSMSVVFSRLARQEI
jgi:hypothetical protein